MFFLPDLQVIGCGISLPEAAVSMAAAPPSTITGGRQHKAR